MIYSREYINMYLSVKKTLHTKNVEKVSREQIKHMSKSYDEELFNHYKKIVFLRWATENSENKLSFAKRVQKLINKLDIELTSSESRVIEGIEAREFTERRAFKTIEVPYKDISEASLLLQPHAYFFYKGMRTYKKRKLFFEKKYDGEIYMTIREVVLYDRENNKIQEVFPHIDIMGITLRNEYVEVKMRNGEYIYFRHKDNELIYISLKRTVAIRNGEGFQTKQRDELLTTEKTIETFLNINNNDNKNTIERTVKAKRKKKR